MADFGRVPLSCWTLLFSFLQHRNTTPPRPRTSDSGIYFAMEKDMILDDIGVNATASVASSGTRDMTSAGKRGSGSGFEVLTVAEHSAQHRWLDRPGPETCTRILRVADK